MPTIIPLSHSPLSPTFQVFVIFSPLMYQRYTFFAIYILRVMMISKVEINICTSFISERDLLLEMMQIQRYLCSCWLNTSASSFSLPYFSLCPCSSQEYKSNQWHFLFKVNQHTLLQKAMISKIVCIYLTLLWRSQKWVLKRGIIVRFINLARLSPHLWVGVQPLGGCPFVAPVTRQHH